jgi:DNA-binding GntR family transcriptional regulator
MFLRARGHPEVGVAEHRVIVDAIKRGDAKTAESTMRRHVLSAAAGVVDFLSMRGDRVADTKGGTDDGR